ncbi:LOW QUALITY PROTEIN: hypothetical protein TorRG33x02_132890 [Trema orientale]|uniref:Uncharacterized protein n=1 Tax=Trema orientale TaxID=63057 RepID=A0A2P5EZC9_TREOI|nr:LOW QUALITY PROTEIN: hypothetical protein TorRG33x02_132890 [Trema orientale]
MVLREENCGQHNKAYILQLIVAISVIETHNDNDSFDASPDPHHMPITNTPHKAPTKGPHKNVGDLSLAWCMVPQLCSL